MRRQNSEGWASLLPIAILVVLVIGIAGYLVFRPDHAKRSTSSATSPTNTSNQSTQTNNLQPVQQYLVIKEWGVQIPLSDSIKDAYYAVPSGVSKNADGKPSSVNLGLVSLNNSCGTVTASGDDYNNNLGGIVRAIPTDIAPTTGGKTYAQAIPNGVTIGDYYYGYSDSYLQSKTCIPDSTKQAIDSAFSTALKSTTAVN